jgi:hypothetical protein
MKMTRIHLLNLSRLLCLAVVVTLVRPAAARLEETFEVLQIGTKTYRNVTVTTKASSYIFIMHAEGMTNLKVADLPDELRSKLGYADTESKKERAQGFPSVWPKKSLPSIKLPRVEQIKETWNARVLGALHDFQIRSRAGALIVGIGLLVYLFLCCCFRMLCLKTNTDPGLVIWLPLLQLIPLTRAAGMAPVWFLAWLVPGLNVIAQIVWSVKISKACGRSAGFGILLLLPIINAMAFLNLVFAGAPGHKEERVVEIMTLEAA